jgi:circadian clock protein KaiB
MQTLPFTARDTQSQVMSSSSKVKFRLYVTESLNSEHAIANLYKLCRDLLPQRCEIELVDVRREPKRALDDGVVQAPLLVKLSPEPTRMILGSLVHREALLQALDLAGIGSRTLGILNAER